MRRLLRSVLFPVIPMAAVTAHAEAARGLLAAITGPDAAATLTAKGITPPR